MVRSSLARLWTPNEEALLEQLLVERKDLRVIAMRLKRSIQPSSTVDDASACRTPGRARSAEA